MASKYQVFCQAVSRKSFTEAAKVLHYSQSAVSQAVKAVEQEVGLTLVLRKKDGIELTSDGKKVYPYIQSVRLRYDHGGGRAGTGRLAFIPVVSERLHRSRGRPSHQGAA